MPSVSIGDAEIHYEEKGEGPPLMLVPGLSGSGSFFISQVPEFSKSFRTIVHDHRGAGRSTHSRIEYSVEQMADDTLRLMDALGIDSAHLVGHSSSRPSSTPAWRRSSRRRRWCRRRHNG